MITCARSCQLTLQHARGGVHELLPPAEELWTVDGFQKRESWFSLKVCPLVGQCAPVDGWPHTQESIGSMNWISWVIKNNKRQHEVEMDRKVGWVWRSQKRGVTMVKIHEILK